MKRFFVCRAYFKWKGKMYYKGDILPADFTHHDKAWTIYNSRIGECEVEETEETEQDTAKIPTPITTPLTGMVSAQEPASPEGKSSEGSEPAEEKPKFHFNLPGTLGE